MFRHIIALMKLKELKWAIILLSRKELVYGSRNSPLYWCSN